MIIHWVFLNIYNIVLLFNAKQHIKIKFLQHLVGLKTKKLLLIFLRFFRALLIKFMFILLFTIIVYLMNQLINHFHIQKSQHRP